MKQHIDTLAADTPPLYTGSRGHVWAYDVATVSERRNGPPAELTAASFVLHAPYAHSLWPNYLLACVSLRAHPAVPAPKINLPGATHEVFLIALNPTVPVVLNDELRLLHPINFAAQFIAADDAEAHARILQAAKDVADGTLHPDTDWTQLWVARFGDSNRKQVA